MALRRPHRRPRHCVQTSTAFQDLTDEGHVSNATIRLSTQSIDGSSDSVLSLVHTEARTGSACKLTPQRRARACITALLIPERAWPHLGPCIALDHANPSALCKSYEGAKPMEFSSWTACMHACDHATRPNTGPTGQDRLGRDFLQDWDIYV